MSVSQENLRRASHKTIVIWGFSMKLCQEYNLPIHQLKRYLKLAVFTTCGITVTHLAIKWLLGELRLGMETSGYYSIYQTFVNPDVTIWIGAWIFFSFLDILDICIFFLNKRTVKLLLASKGEFKPHKLNYCILVFKVKCWYFMN